jgi:uncharacterized protein (TIGR04255 family)
MKEKLPKFDNPPVVETVLGVEFEPLHLWQIPHFGLFWNKIRSEYQQFSVQAPLPQQVERFGSEANTFTINLAPQPQARCWFFDSSNSWLLQIQNSRFISNWKQNHSSYPNYDGFYERFEKEWNNLNAFLSEEGLGTPKLLQCDVSYINHVEVGDDFDFDNLGEIFPAWAGLKKDGFLPQPDAIAINSVYAIPENLGRLYIEMQPVIRQSDFKTTLQLSVTAKVKIASNEKLKESIDLAHQWVIEGFTDFTSDKNHKIWQRTR